MPALLVRAQLACLLLFPLIAEAQDRERKQARASRVAEATIRVDGRLEEEVWQRATAISDFVQKQPDEGAPATERTEVRFAFDNEALYVGARMYSSTPIQAPLGRRDESEQAEYLEVSLDTYLDRRTASALGVTATGVRLDHFYASDDESNDDATFNPVWEARTSIDSNGWTAELWIPFSQLRFNERTPQIWGLNVRRWIPSRNEEAFWSPVLRTEERWASVFGDLHGLDGVRPGQRIEVTPYTAAGARVVADAPDDNPFNSGANLTGRIGGDVKIGIGSSLTFEATVNPDFGQVEADPAEVNLSAFETFFDERRPFFVEGANLLRGNVNNYFYSRRIGAPPSGPADGDYVDYPSTTTILAAGKLTGRLKSGLSIGLLGAVTDDESARIVNGGQFGRVQVAPRTTYGVGRLTQEIGSQGSVVGLMGTVVRRELSPGDVLANQLTRNALTLSGDSVIRFGDYELQGYAGLSYADGETGALQRLQRASARYYQRPDIDYVTFDPNRTSLTGSKGGFSVERQNARHWLWLVDAAYETPGFETNDIGRFTSGDGIRINGSTGYQQTTPGRRFREYSLNVGQEMEWTYGGDRQVSRTFSNLSVTWPNFWEAEFETSYDFRRQDMRLTRGGPSMEAPSGWATNLRLETSDAAETTAGMESTYARTEDGGLTFALEGELAIRPAPQWRLAIAPRYEREVNTQQYVATLAGGRPATYGSSYIFGRVDRTTYSAQIRFNFTFKPDLNLDLYAEPFASSGRYESLGELAAPRGRLLLPIDPATVGVRARNFNVQSFRSNLVLRWEWRAGSTLYFVWQQDRAQDEGQHSLATAGDLFRAFGAPGDHSIAVKASYWFSPR
ncbi:MAG: DUF5916 domain-containing protein [Vicinamibacterales bacterium]